MSRRGNCYDNAVMESFFSTVKSELGEHFESYGEAKMELFDYIEVFYNQRRRHSTLGQISPAASERQDAPITDQRLYSRWAALVWERTLCSRPRTFPARARRSSAAPTTRKRLAGNYGLEKSGGMTALVMELVEGDDARGSDRAGSDSGRRGAADRETDRRGARSGARAGHHPSRSEAGEHQGPRPTAR